MPTFCVMCFLSVVKLFDSCMSNKLTYNASSETPSNDLAQSSKLSNVCQQPTIVFQASIINVLARHQLLMRAVYVLLARIISSSMTMQQQRIHSIVHLSLRCPFSITLIQSVTPVSNGSVRLYHISAREYCVPILVIPNSCMAAVRP
jgi:hypothetical protein